MKIAIISSVLPYHGGMGRVLDFEAKELQKRNIDFTVFVPDYGKDVMAHCNAPQQYNIEYLKPNLKIGFGAICFDLIKKIEEGNFDIIYLHYPAYGLAELLLSKKIKSKIIIRYHMDVVGKDIFRKIFFTLHNKFIMPLILKKADKIIFSTKDYGDNSVAKNFVNKSIEIPFGVDIEKFNFNENIKKENQILFVAKLDKQHYFKGLENLINAFSKINNIDNIKLKIIGNGDMLKYYKNVIVGAHCNAPIEFKTEVNDEELKQEYQKSICTILPSTTKEEAFGLVLIESFACGTPVVAANLPGVRSLTENNRGLICELNNINSLKEQLEKMLNMYFDNQEEYKKMQINCISSIKEKYNWESVIERLLTIF